MDGRVHARSMAGLRDATPVGACVRKLQEAVLRDVHSDPLFAHCAIPIYIMVHYIMVTHAGQALIRATPPPDAGASQVVVGLQSQPDRSLVPKATASEPPYRHSRRVYPTRFH